MASGYRRKVGRKGKYLARGTTKREWWDVYPRMSTRLALKRDTQKELSEALDFRDRNC